MQSAGLPRRLSPLPVNLERVRKLEKKNNWQGFLSTFRPLENVSDCTFNFPFWGFRPDALKPRPSPAHEPFVPVSVTHVRVVRPGVWEPAPGRATWPKLSGLGLEVQRAT